MSQVPPRAVAATATAAVVGLTAIAVTAIAITAIAYPSHGDRWLGTTLFAGLVAGATGAALLAAARRAVAGLPVALMGAATVAWGVGQLLVARQLWQAVPVTYPTLGTKVSMMAAMIAIAGVLLAARGGSRGIGLRRVVLDAMLLGGSGALLVWRLAFANGPLDAAASTATGRTAVVVLLTECVVVGLLLLLWLRDLEHGLVLAVGGLLLYVVPDLVMLHARVQPGGDWPWQAGVLRALAWPLIGVGVLRFSSQRRACSPSAAVQEGPLERSDARVTAATTVLSFGLLVAAMLSVLREPGLDPVTVQLALLVILVFGAREVVGGLQRQGLLRGLTQLAFHDPLTGLGNRRALTRRLDSLTASDHTSVLTLDLDGFKEVNDILGHASGDALLVAVSTSVRRCLLEDVEAFRIGGDEFAVIVPGPVDRARVVAERLLIAVRDAADAVPGAGAVQVSASVGAASLGKDVLTGLVESGVALRAAKAAGRDRVELYDGPVAARHRRVLLVERRLREAVADAQIVPHYQPIVDLRSRRVVGVEALARWDDEVLGRVAPDEFIGVAERSGLIAAVGASVMTQSIRDLSSLAGDAGAPRLGVNASVAQLRRAGYADSVLAMIEQHGLAASALIVEVTESLFVDVDDPAVRELRVLRDAGVHVAIDDFGSGYSSLAYLARMPADIIKIDRALTVQVLHDPRSGAVLRSIVSLAQSLPMDVVIEGIEIEAVHDLVRDVGASFGQGWLYGAAVPFAELVELIADINRKASRPSRKTGVVTVTS